MTSEKMQIIINIQAMQYDMNGQSSSVQALDRYKIEALREMQNNMIEAWNKHSILNKMAKRLKLSIDEECVNIYVDNGEDEDATHVVYWHLDEVKDDPSVALVMAKAVELFHTDPKQLLKFAQL